MNKKGFLLGFVFLLISLSVHAQNKGMKFQARIKDTTSGAYINQSGANINIKILSPNNCVLWDELHTSVNIVDGFFSVVVGNGAPQSLTPSGMTFLNVFSNSSTLTGLTCYNSDNTVSSTTSYVPLSSDVRKIRFSTTVGADPIMADFSLRSSAYAISAESVQGKAASDFILKDHSNPNQESNLNAITSASNFSKLNDIFSGTYSAPTATGLAAWPANCPTGQYVKSVSATGVLSCEAPSGGGGGSVTSVAGRTGAVVLSNTDISGLGGAAVKNVGTTAGTVAAGDDSRFTDARTPTGSAGGDLSGTYPSPSVVKIRGVAVSPTAPTTNQVLAFDGTQYAPTTFTVMSTVNFTGNLGGDITGNQGTTVVGKIQGIPINPTAPTTGQVLQYNGTVYTPVTLPTAPVASVAGRTGTVVLSNADISGLGAAATMAVGTTAGTVAAGDDARFTDARTPTGAAGGDISGTYPNPTVSKIQGRAVSVTAPTSGQVLAWNGSAWAPATAASAPVSSVNGLTGAVSLTSADVGALSDSAFNAYVASANCTASQTMYWNSVSGTFSCQSISVSNFSGSLAGDITGTQSATVVGKLQGRSVSSTAPTSGQVLSWNGSAWAPSTPAAAPVTTVAGRTGDVVLTNTDITGLGGSAVLNVGTAAGTVAAGDDARFTNARTPTGAAGGDISGTYPNPTVAKIQGVAVSATAPTTGQMMVYNGTEWIPTTDPVSYVRSTADQTFNTTAMTNATSLSFAVVSGKVYKFKFMVLFQSAAATTGIRLGVTSPTGTLSASASIPVAIDGTTALFVGWITSSGDSVIGTGVQTTATVYAAEVEGTFIATANGTLQLQAASEVNGSVITVKAGSNGQITVLP